MMTEQEVRALVREVIARHPSTALGAGRSAALGARGAAVPLDALRAHASHGTFVLPTGADAEGPCIIEPAVPCNHCGYCKSYGH